MARYEFIQDVDDRKRQLREIRSNLGFYVESGQLQAEVEEWLRFGTMAPLLPVFSAQAAPIETVQIVETVRLIEKTGYK